MSMDDLQTMLAVVKQIDSDSPCLNVRDFTYLYSLSKAIVIEESRVALQYIRVKLHEMLEMIARVAFFKFDNTLKEGLPLSKKIETVFEELFLFHLGREHNDG